MAVGTDAIASIAGNNPSSHNTREPFGEILTLPTAASAPGALGQRFATDLWVRNTTAVGRRFSLRIACPTCGESPAWIVLNLGPSETRFLPDVIFDFLGGGIGGRAGAIEIAFDPSEGGLDVSARVATVNADRPGNGTTIPARTREEARTQATFIGLAGLGGDAGARVNAGAFNPNDSATAVTFFVRDAAGKVAIDKGRTLDDEAAAKLLGLAWEEVHLLELEPGDLHEEPAGARISAAAEDEVLRCPECGAILLRVKGSGS